MQGPARGYSLWTCFFCIFFRNDCKTKTTAFKKDLVLRLHRFALFLLLKSMQPQLKTIQPQLKKEAGKKYRWGRKVLFNCKCQFQFIIANAKTCKGDQGGTLCGPAFFCIFLESIVKRKQLLSRRIFFWVCTGLLCLCFWKACNHNVQPQFKTKRKQEKIQVRQKGSF